VEAVWSGAEANGQDEHEWKGWWPDLDIEATRRLTQGSRPHERGLALLEKPGRLVLASLVNLPPGESILRIESSGTISDAELGNEQPATEAEPGQSTTGKAEFSVRSQAEPLYLTFAVETGRRGGPVTIRASYATTTKGPFKKLERERLWVPWAPVPAASPPSSVAADVPELNGGDPRRGETLFFGDQAKCSQCHAIGGRGGNAGPDLTRIAVKGRDHIYRSIAAPSAEIAPDYMPYTIAAKDGRVLVGVVRAERAEAIRVTDTNAKTIILRRDEIDQIRPSGTSIMPVGLAAGLGQSMVRDLIAYLTSRQAGETDQAPQIRGKF
jgi:putative heme-binding domain-containing protein